MGNNRVQCHTAPPPWIRHWWYMYCKRENVKKTHLFNSHITSPKIDFKFNFKDLMGYTRREREDKCLGSEKTNPQKNIWVIDQFRCTYMYTVCILYQLSIKLSRVVCWGSGWNRRWMQDIPTYSHKTQRDFSSAVCRDY